MRSTSEMGIDRAVRFYDVLRDTVHLGVAVQGSAHGPLAIMSLATLVGDEMKGLCDARSELHQEIADKNCNELVLDNRMKTRQSTQVERVVGLFSLYRHPNILNSPHKLESSSICDANVQIHKSNLGNATPFGGSVQAGVKKPWRQSCAPLSATIPRFWHLLSCKCDTKST